MKKFIFCFLALYQALTYTANPRSFGEHDPLDTKAAFCEMMQNHTKTKTEMFYRTAGLFSILNVCRKKPKEVEQSDWNERIVAEIFAEKIQKKEKHVEMSPKEEQHAWTLLQKDFEKTFQEYKGTQTYRVGKYILMADDDTEPETKAYCSTILGKARISINPKNYLFERYFKLVKSSLNIKNVADMVAPFLADPNTSFLKRKITGFLVNFLVRFSASRLQAQQEKIQATLFHEFSHPYIAKISSHLRKHRLPGESKNIPVIEAYCNTLAVLNSPHPLRTARNIRDSNTYHSSHLPALAKALKKEGVKE